MSQEKNKDFRSEIDWVKIKKDCPKALNMLLKSKYCFDSHGYPIYLYLRDLYEFFDDNGIRCFVGYSDNSGSFKLEIRTKLEPSKDDNDWRMQRVGFIETYSTRQEAEVVVLAKAFEILESK